MQVLFKLLFTLIIIFALAIKSDAQDSAAKRLQKVSFVVGKSLGEYFPLDSVQSIMLHNWKGDHNLTTETQASLISKFKKFTYVGKHAQIKPGHVWGKIIFKNAKSLHFYSNNEQMVISTDGKFTFIANQKINFDNY
jgi:hypothetical protein